MRESRIPNLSRRLPALLVVLAALVMLPASGRGDDTQEEAAIPDCVCFPVDGTGYIVTYGDAMAKNGLRIPVGTLSPLMEGDSLVVESGTITVFDFRNGSSSQYGENSRFVIPAVIDPTLPGRLERLADAIKRTLNQPQRNRIGGSVRGARAAFWPDGGRFAPELPIVFEWWRVRPAPARILVQAGDRAEDLEVNQAAPGSGALTWSHEWADLSGPVTWTLLDDDGESLGGGEFTVLTPEQAEAERARFEEAAASIDVIPRSLAASVLAAADGAFLW